MVLVRRFVYVLIVLLAVVAIGGMVTETIAQTKKKPAAKSEKSTKKEPTKEETEEYIVMMLMGNAKNFGFQLTEPEEIEAARIDNCQLFVKTKQKPYVFDADEDCPRGRGMNRAREWNIDMRSLDIGRSHDKREMYCRRGVQCVLMTGYEEEICKQKSGREKKNLETKSYPNVGFSWAFRESDDDARFERALKHEAMLCGARDSSRIKKDLF